MQPTFRWQLMRCAVSMSETIVRRRWRPARPTAQRLPPTWPKCVGSAKEERQQRQRGGDPILFPRSWPGGRPHREETNASPPRVPQLGAAAPRFIQSLRLRGSPPIPCQCPNAGSRRSRRGGVIPLNMTAEPESIAETFFATMSSGSTSRPFVATHPFAGGTSRSLPGFGGKPRGPLPFSHYLAGDGTPIHAISNCAQSDLAYHCGHGPASISPWPCG
jgi:hypothetical protein